uniref:PHD-type domain-containing protein n=1 Tax=Heterorhabditis bacteriophora TaxID=37862 RepID=A0A1I7XH93_HETBA
MVVEALNIDTKKLTCSEKNILQNLECWFGKPSDFNLTWEEYLKTFVISMEEAKDKCELIGKHSKKTIVRTKQLLAASIYRPNRDISPPLCILCLNAAEDADVMGGVLRWIPQFPSFFAVHEMCMLFIPEISCVEEPTALGAQMSDINLLELSTVVIKRGRKLYRWIPFVISSLFLYGYKCTLCSQSGAMLGCHVRECRSSFHLPCAIKAGCYLNYVEYQCLCPRHPDTAFLDYRNYVYAQVTKIGNAMEEMKDLQVSQEQTCGICLDNVNNRLELNEVVMSVCCSAKFYHFECIKV